ncbi:MAG: hypothetical protein SOY80_05860 [Bacilli bacterium]|nr:hypothetical protein [Bacilli bacterium]
MKRFTEQNYYIRTINTHLVNLLEENYYIELGVVDMDILTKIIDGENLDISEILNYDLLNTGIGQISKDLDSEVNYQLNYLLSLRQKSSTNKFFLTSGTLTYLDDNGCEKYAPIVLIPIEIDYISRKIVASGNPISNRRLIKLLALKNRDTQEEQNRFLETHTNVTFNNIRQIDNYMVTLATDVNCTYSPSCYLTVCEVEYYDFTINNDFFVTERSRYETSDIEIIKNYFENVCSILPTNIDQKYIILKVLQGDNFVVDGRLGSGKTHTILNILANCIKNNKKVLYINQDLDNILDVEKNLKYLGLGQSIYNLTKSILDIEVPKMSLPTVREVDFKIEDIEKICTFQQKLDERINGFTIRYILEELSLIKNSHLNINEIKIENDLEKYEVDTLYQSLKETEDAFKVVENYDNNIWKNLNITHNNLTEFEIIDRTNKLFDCQVKLNKEINSFCKRFEIVLPKDINDLSKLLSHIVNFGLTKPLASWKSRKVRNEVVKALGEIQMLSDENYNTTKYYEKFVCIDYKPGYASGILKELCDKNIKLKNEDDADNIYLDNLLSVDTKLQTLIDKIELTEEKFKKFDNKIDAEFGIKNFHRSLNDDYFNLFEKMYRYLTTNSYTLSIWTNYFVASFSDFLNVGEKVKDNQIRGLEVRKVFQPYLINRDALYFEEISQMINARLFNKIIKKYFDQKAIKTAKVNFQDIIQSVKTYYEIIKQTVIYVSDPEFTESKSIEGLIDNYVGLYDFLSELNNNQKEIMKSIFSRQSNSIKLDFENLKSCLEIFVNETKAANELIKKLKDFNINIDVNHAYQARKLLSSYIPYLTKAIELKNELTRVFKGKKALTSFDILDLVKIDEQYTEVQETMLKNEERYRKLLGNNYRGFDTIINEVGQALEHFDELVSRLEPNADVSDLFQEPTLSRLIENAIHLNSTWSEWINNFRLFSFCFKGGKNFLQTNPFKENIVVLTEYVQSTSHVKHILQINETLKTCQKYKLNSLVKLIENANSTTLLADSYLYATLKVLYKKIQEDMNSVLDFSIYENEVEKLYDYEMELCTKNILYFQSLEERKNKNKLSNVDFNDFEKTIEILSKNVPVFLADVSIFNTNIKLDHFDLVIIDDGHLSSANKYNRINECKQCVIFGDKSFQSSYVNTLMQRVNEASTINLRNRYIKMTPKFNNTWTFSNRYIYSLNTKITKTMVNSINHFASSIIDIFNKNKEQVYNVIVGNETTRREVYQSLVKSLEENYASDEIIQILSENIRIVNALNEGAKYVNNVIIYYNDFEKLEQAKKELIFKNFIVVSNGIYIYYVGTRVEDDNNRMLKSINNTIGRTEQHSKYLSGISTLLFERLKSTGLSVREGFGYFDIIINEKNIVGVIVIGTANNKPFSLLDEYNYYYHEYQKNGWIVEVLYVGDLVDHFDDTIDELTKISRGDGK